MLYHPERLLIDARVLNLPVTRRVMANLPDLTPEFFRGRLPAGAGKDPPRDYLIAKRTLIVMPHPLRALRDCRPSADFELPLGASCPGLCQYCYLQSSLGPRPYVKVYADLDAILTEVPEAIAAHPDRLVTFEGASLSDPIGVEHLTGSLGEVISFFGKQPHAYLRLVTKFAYTSGLVGLGHGSHTHIRYSLNTPHVAGGFEGGTDPVAARIAAANEIGRAGYPIGFVLAPLMLYPGWRREYEELLDYLAANLERDLHRELTFELISHRFSAKAKQIILERFPRCRLDLDEASRQIKHGRYGRKKFVYPAGEFNQLMYEVRASIERFFPAAKVEYQV